MAMKMDDAERLALSSLGINVLVTGLKYFLGVFSGSLALLADAVHSSADVVSSASIWGGIRLSRRKSKRFPYGLYKLENLVALELKRRGYDLYYWRNPQGEEVDFVVMENEKVTQLIQVSYDISFTENRERELRALKKGMKHFDLNKGLILTASHEESIIEENVEIDVLPITRWLL